MFTPYLAFFLIGNALALAAPAPAPVRADNDPDKRTKFLISRLDSKISEVQGDINLAFLVGTLGDLASEPGYEKNPQLQCAILVNVEAFRKVNEGMFDPEQKQIKFSVKFKDVPLSSILKIICDQLDATYVVRRNHIEILPLVTLREELLLQDDANIMMLPLVCWLGSDAPLEWILQDFARRYDANIVISPAAKEKAKTVITARLLNAPLEVAVKTLVEMAELRLVRRSNILIVTTKDQAAEMNALAESKTALKPVEKKKKNK